MTAVLALGHVLLAFGLTACGPLWLLLVAPLAFGVPHLVADLRFLVLRGPAGLSGANLRWMAWPFGLMTLLRGLALAGRSHPARVELALGFGALAGVVAAAPGPRARRCVAIALVAALAIPALWAPRGAALVLGHGHNLVALVFLVLAARARGQGAGVGAVTVLALVAGGAILGGALDEVAGTGLAGGAAGYTLEGAVATLAPGVPSPWGSRLVLAFAFLQAVHYSIWVHLLPALLGGGRGLAAELDEVLGEGGRPLAGVAVGAAVLLPLLGWVDPVGARGAYLSLVAFHAWLELAVLGQLAVTGDGLAAP